MRKITGGKIAKNLTLSIAAEIISLAVSFVMGFIVPKFIDEYQYAYWQAYLLYSGYVGILSFGVLHGMVLRYSQFDYDELDKPRVRSQFQVLLFILSILCVIGCVASVIFAKEEYKYIFILVSISIIIKNVYTYTSYTLQMTNRINYYATLVVAYRLIYAVIVIILLCCGIGNFYWYCIADMLGDLSGIVLSSFFNKGLFFGRGLPVRSALAEYKLNISAGIFLLVANYAFKFLIGGAKMVVQWHWDELVFGKVSFAFSVINLFLTCVTAVSVVLFPSLKRMEEKELPSLYGKIRNAISPILFFMLLLYFPMCWILELWLPSYAESLVYLGVLLPVIIFASKINLLTNNYLKAYRKEKTMLAINLISIVVGFSLALICAYVLNDLDLLLYSVVLVITLCSISSEIVVGKITGRKGIFDYIVEIIMTVIFIAVARYLSLWWGCLAYAIALIIYFVLYRKNLVAMLNMVKDVIQKRKAKKQGVEDNQKETDISDNTIE